MSTIRELSNVLNKAALAEESLATLVKEYNKLTRILRCILDDSRGELTKEQLKYINSTNEFVPYGMGVNDNGEVIVTSHVQLHTN